MIKFKTLFLIFIFFISNFINSCNGFLKAYYNTQCNRFPFSSKSISSLTPEKQHTSFISERYSRSLLQHSFSKDIIENIKRRKSIMLQSSLGDNDSDNNGEEEEEEEDENESKDSESNEDENEKNVFYISGNGSSDIYIENEDTLEPIDGVIDIDMRSELSSSFLQYAMSTILGRALPDARDGLKPVHRRILYAMHVLNLNPEGSYRKCARVVGEVLGKYHPHGDMSVYDALVRMAQDFVMSSILIQGHGNFGSIDDDPPAAMRYTECKLSALAKDGLLSDIGSETIKFVQNFDGNELEPLVLPARVPMLLLNGGTGIAVGMATNIPPHNLGELLAACIELVQTGYELSDEDLLKIVPGPDFPTGGAIIGSRGSYNLYTTGQGSISIRSKTHIAVVSSGKSGTSSRNAIIITELPYMVNKAALLSKIADLVNDKKLEGIADLRDESDREGIRVVIELKRDAIPSVVENNLLKKTGLQVSFAGNMLALTNDGKQPTRLTLRNALITFLEFRFNCIRKRSQYDLDKLNARLHIVDGLLIALTQIDDVVNIVRSSKDTTEAKLLLQGEKYNLSETQATAILGITLGRLTAMETSKLNDEKVDLISRIEILEDLMTNDKSVNTVMINEFKDIKDKYAVPRRTELRPEESEIDDIQLIANERSVVVFTESGYIKRMPLSEFESQNRGTRGKAGAKLSNSEDAVLHLKVCNDHDHVIFITEKGIAYSLRAYKIPIAGRTAKGTPIPQILPLSSDDSIASISPVGDSFNDDEYFLLLTKNGYIKKTQVSAFHKISSRGLIIISLEPGDRLGWVRRVTDYDDVMISTTRGYSTRFAAVDLRPTGRSSRGCRGIKLRENDLMCDMDIIDCAREDVKKRSERKEKYLLAVTKSGYGKRISSEEFRAQKRGGMGVISIKFKNGLNDHLACMRTCSDDDEIVLSTEKGTIVRQKVKDISIQSRSATGVMVQRVDKENFIKSVALVPEALV